MPRLDSTKNDVWNLFFKQHRDKILRSIDKTGLYRVTAGALSDVSHSLSGPDVRNLTKFDRTAQLPDVFKQEALSMKDYINILPLGHLKENTRMPLDDSTRMHLSNLTRIKALLKSPSLVVFKR